LAQCCLRYGSTSWGKGEKSEKTDIETFCGSWFLKTSEEEAGIDLHVPEFD
jgi:hypothetical protein